MVDKYLKEYYENPENPASYSGPDKVYRALKEGNHRMSRGKIKKYLQSQEYYTVQKQARRRFKRRKVIAPHMNYQWDIDSAYMVPYGKSNDNFKYFLVAIDVFSRFARTAALKTLQGKEVASALNKMLSNSPYVSKIRSDKGTEMVNKDVALVLKNHNVEHFRTQNELKANYAERLIKTLKSTLTRYMTDHNNHRWVDELQKVTDSYNNTYHRSIKMKPADVTNKDEDRLWKLEYEFKPKLKPVKKESKKPPKEKSLFKFKLNDAVRISGLRQPFDKAYSEHWTREVFFVTSRKMNQGLPIYTLKDYDNDPIVGTFQESELQKVYIGEDTVFKIEKVLKYRGSKSNRQALVKWQGWPKKFNSWIKASDIQNLT